MSKYESGIQGEILNMVRHQWKWQAHKNEPGPSLSKGWPDISVYIPGGKVVLLEIKRPGEGLSKTQRYVTTLLIEDGFTVYAVDNVSHATRVLRKEYENVCEQKAKASKAS